jgi:chromosome segregation ATPase
VSRREVLFISAASTSESSRSSANADDTCGEDPMTTIARLRQQNRCLLDDKLKEQERLKTVMRVLAEISVEAATMAATSAIKKVMKAIKDTLYEFESERSLWKGRAKNAEKEVALLETELEAVQQERAKLKKTIRKLNANISDV